MSRSPSPSLGASSWPLSCWPSAGSLLGTVPGERAILGGGESPVAPGARALGPPTLPAWLPLAWLPPARRGSVAPTCPWAGEKVGFSTSVMGCVLKGCGGAALPPWWTVVLALPAVAAAAPDALSAARGSLAAPERDPPRVFLSAAKPLGLLGAAMAATAAATEVGRLMSLATGSTMALPWRSTRLCALQARSMHPMLISLSSVTFLDRLTRLERCVGGGGSVAMMARGIMYCAVCMLLGSTPLYPHTVV
mmetsp:Transcript_17780/g.44853  ORF Transcript_17780/g.44853 Transcript_17780/m.44853 type:complete len:250 (-) Transcript_17780:920-1669(-)